MGQLDPYVMTTSAVARSLGVGVERVRQLDAELRPIRRANGHRYYDPSIVDEYRRSREQGR
jgi:DNA-binding transcriptional MerR regulator